MEEQEFLIDVSQIPQRTHKICKICGIEKPLEEFNKHPITRDGLNIYCKACDSIRAKEWQEKHPNYARNYARKYYRENRRNELSRALVRYYGITMDDKERMLIEQDYKCSICGKELELFGRDTHVDHNHETGEIRSILCNSCNSMIGHAKEDKNILLKAVEYLDKFT